MTRKTFVGFITFVLFVPLGAIHCTAWDPAVGVKCTEFPAYCARHGGDAPSEAGASDAGTVVSPVAEGGVQEDGSAVNPDTPVSFARDLRPLINRSETDPSGPGCSNCHYRGAGTQQGIIEGQFEMTTLGDIRKGGGTSHGTIIVPGNPEASAIIQKLRGTYPTGSRMPWSGPPYWSDAEIQLMANWIAQGAKGADSE